MSREKYRSRRSRSWGQPRTRIVVDHDAKTISGTVVVQPASDGCPHAVVTYNDTGQRRTAHCELESGHTGMHAGDGRRWS